MSRGGLHPDVALEIRLNATATRHCRVGTWYDHAVEDLRTIADGRTDLLAKAAGDLLGGYLANPGMSNPATTKMVAMLVDAGADVDLIAPATDRARHLAQRGGHSTPV